MKRSHSPDKTESQRGSGEGSTLGPGKRTLVEGVSPAPREASGQPVAKMPRTTGVSLGLDAYASDSEEEVERTERSPSPTGSDGERHEEEQAPMVLPTSSLQLQTQARMLVDALAPYAGDDWDALRGVVVADLLRLQRFLTPPSDGVQNMWHDDDPILGILSEGFQRMLGHVEANSALSQIFRRHPGLVDKPISFGGPPAANATFLTFLKEAATDCAQASDGMIGIWIRRIADAKS